MKAFIIAILAVAAVSQGSAQLTALSDQAVQFPPPGFSKFAGFPPSPNQQWPTLNFQDEDGNIPVLQSLGPQLSQSLQSFTDQLPALSNPSSNNPSFASFPPTQNLQIPTLNFQDKDGNIPVLQSLGPQFSQNLQNAAPQLAAMSNPAVTFPDLGANLQNFGSQFPQSLQGIAPQFTASPNQPFPSGAFNPAMIQNLQSGFQSFPQGLTGLGQSVNFGQPGTPFPISAAENARNVETAMKTPAFKNFIDGLMKRPDVVGWRQAF